MKKQWYCPNLDDIFRSHIATLYHNGKYFCNKFIPIGGANAFYDWCEKNGYTEGYDQEDYETALEYYTRIKENRIEELCK